MKWHEEWKGTNEEVKDTVEFYLNEIMNEFDVDRKMAKKYLSEALSRNNIVSSVKDMCEYLKQTY